MRNKLTDEQRIYVVKRLAVFHSLISIVRGLQQEFGITISQQAVHHYNAERSEGKQLAPRWKDLFWAARRDYIASVANVGNTGKAERLRRCEAMMHKHREAGRHALANAILDAIARDIGGSFGKKRRA
jgi:hypothetical protein